MLHELDALEVRRIADLAAALRKARDRLLEQVPEAGFDEPEAGRGAHEPLRELAPGAALAGAPEFVALREAIAGLPRDIRTRLWVVAEIGRGQFAILDTERALAEASVMSDQAIADRLIEDPDLHDILGKGLYQLGAAILPGEAS